MSDNYDLNFNEKNKKNYDLNFGKSGRPPILLSCYLEVGESFKADFILTQNLSGSTISVGEMVGKQGVFERDMRLYPIIAKLEFPISAGLSLRPGEITWQSPYTVNKNVAHTLVESFGTELTVKPRLPIIFPEIEAYEIFIGNESRPVYSLKHPEVIFWDGSVASGFLATKTNNFASIGWEGVTIFSTLSPKPQFAAIISEGASAFAELDTRSSSSFLGVGENVKAELYVYDLMGVVLSEGVSLSGNLTSKTTFSTLLADGALVNCEIETRGSLNPYVQLYDGQALLSTLTVSSKYACVLSIGEEIKCQLDTREGSPLTLTFNTGESVFIPEIKAAPGIFIDNILVGQSVFLSELSTNPPWRVSEGAAVRFEFATEIGVPCSLLDGSVIFANLDIRPFIPISANLYHGEEFLPERPYVTHRAYFSCSIFYSASPFACLDDTHVDFDLRKELKIDETNWFWNPDDFCLELDDPPLSRPWGSGCGEVVWGELCTLPRFSSSLYEGQYFTSRRGYEFVDSVINDGSTIIRNDPLYIEPIIRLCYPNIFPNADRLDVELEWEEEGCGGDFVFCGENFKCKLVAFYNFSDLFLHGVETEFDFTPFPPLRVTFWEGAKLKAELRTKTTFNANLNLNDGVTLTTTFEEKPCLMWTGESVSAELDMTFEVEFLEVGCLDNEYIPLNVHGDPDYSKRLPVCVEGYEFQHDIKARCF